MIPSLDPGLETRCPPPKESLDVFPSQKQEAVPVLPQAEQPEGTGQDHRQYRRGGQKEMSMAGRMCGAPKGLGDTGATERGSNTGLTKPDNE